MIPVLLAAEADVRLKAVLSREAAFSPDIDQAARTLLDDVRLRGDRAVLEATEKFDRVRPPSLRVPQEVIEAAEQALPADLREIILEAADNIRRFHLEQREKSWFMDDPDGVVLGQRIVPMERAGLYVPGGTAFYPSSLLMNAIPAQVAGVDELIIASPPGASGWPHPTVLATARLLGITHIFAMGGAQAIGAMAYGTETVPRVDKIVGPGNAYVASAKKQVYGNVSIDSVAGPSEIVVLADETANPVFVAADLLSQAEHDVRASAILVTDSAALAEAVAEEISRMVPKLPRHTFIEAALRNYSACIVTDTFAEAIDFTNRLAPEHLEIITRDPWETMTHIRHAGAIFLGPWSSEPVGDYFAGPNHVLPTGGTARFASALGVHDFVRRQSVIHYSAARMKAKGSKIVRFAEAESLHAHALAVQVRLDDLAG